MKTLYHSFSSFFKENGSYHFTTQKKILKKLEALSGGETINAADESLSYKEKTEINENKDK